MTTPRRHLEPTGRRNRRIAAAAAGLALLAVLVTVLVTGGDEDPERAANGAPGNGTSTTAGPAATDGATPGAAAGSGAPSGTPDPATDAIVTPTELEPFLLRGSDLPAGWRTLDTARAATDDLMGSCLRKATTPTVPHALRSISLRSGSNGPVLTSTVRDFTTPAQSARAMSAVRSAVLACARGSSKPALTTFAFASKADASVGVTFTITQDGSSARGEVVVARVGARSVTLALIGLDDTDLRIGQDSVRTVVARLD